MTFFRAFRGGGRGGRGGKRITYFRYFILNGYFHLGYITSNVQEAIKEFHSKTCVRFVHYQRYHRNYVEFSNSHG